MSIEIPLWNSDRPALVDDEFVYLQRFVWRLNKGGYVIRHSDGVVRLHHAIVGNPPKGFITDHVNRNKLDNRRVNLRFLTLKQSKQNVGPQRRNSTGLRGVWFRKEIGKFGAHAGLNGQKFRLGYYSTALEAAEVAKRFRLANMLFTVET